MTSTANRDEQSYRAELEAKIPGWGSDLDLETRPAVPKEKVPPQGTGAHWSEPERQTARIKIHKSPEHKDLTATFGTACPPKGLSGVLRTYAYGFSEGRMAHWMLLFVADRVDVWESRLGEVLRGRLFNPIAEAGVAAEFKKNGLRARFGQRRSDVLRLRNELIMMASLAALAWVGVRRMLKG